MNFPYRFTAAIFLPRNRSAICCGSPPRSTRMQRNSALMMRRPTRGLMERVTVSTSGNSGTSKTIAVVLEEGHGEFTAETQRTQRGHREDIRVGLVKR